MSVNDKLEAVHPYHDEEGRLLCEMRRYRNLETGNKRLEPRRVEHNQVFNNLNGTRRVLYNLPAVIRAETVVVAEGEGKVDVLATVYADSGRTVAATCNLFGAGKWRDEYSPFLRDKKVILLPDNDEPGRRHMEQVAASLERIAAETHWCELPNLPEAGDVVDYLKSHSPEELRALIEAAPLFQSAAPEPEQPIKPASRAGAGENTTAARAPLHSAIRDVVLDKETPPFDKRRAIRDLVRSELLGVGYFCRTVDERTFYFGQGERRLYDMEQQPFQHLLGSLSGLSATEPQFRFCLDCLRTEAARKEPVSVHSLSHYDAAAGTLTVSDGGGGVWRRERRGRWEARHNGDGGLLFLTESGAQPWKPEFGDKRALSWFLGQPLFSDGQLARDEQQMLLLMFALQIFFPPLRRTRIIPAALGPQGSGKTSAWRMFGTLLTGPDFDVTGLSANREDAFVAAVCNRIVVALDNADSRIPWLEDALATYATGQKYRLRKLYTTNEEVSYSPRAVLLLSSRDPHFRRPDVAERLLPLHFCRPKEYAPEERLFTELLSRRGAIMGELLTRAGAVADSLARITLPNLPFRMADFAAFGWAVANGAGQEDEWIGLLRKLETSQMQFAGDGDSLVIVLRSLLDTEGKIGPVSTGELYRRCNQLAQSDSLPFPKSAQSFGRHLTNMQRVIEIELDAQMCETPGGGNKRLISIVRRGE